MSFRKKEQQSKPVLALGLQEHKTKYSVKELFEGKCNTFENNDIEASVDPFNHCLIKNFLCHKDGLPAEEFVRNLRKELLELEFNAKSNDLYKFRQTNELMIKPEETELSKCNHHLRTLCLFFKNHLLPWLRDVTGMTLNDKIDMFCAQYSSTDCLLCHDDQLEERRIAYVYYLNPDWSVDNGGTLDLFNSVKSTDLAGLYDPHEVVKSIIPSFNSFIFFQVSPKSFHQVAEVLSSSNTRLSLSGWFHGPTNPRPCLPIPTKFPLIPFTPSTEDTVLLSDWLNPDYLALNTQGTIQEQFVEDSEIQLEQFFQVTKLKEVKRALERLEDRRGLWRLCGPPNKCRYHSFKDPQTAINQYNREYSDDSELNDSLEDSVRSDLSIINAIIELFKSEEMFLFLSNLTGLSLHPMAVDSDDEESPATKRIKRGQNDSGCRYQFRRWDKGSYTLVRDNDAEHGELALDVNLFFTPGKWSEYYGGCTTYIAAQETEELLTTVPADNCLAIAYRDRDAIRFVKHINHTAIGSFYDLSFVYYE